MSAVETSVLGAMMSIEQGVTDGAQKSETSWYQFSKTFNVVGTSVQGDADKMRGMIHDALVGIDTSLTGNTRLWELLDETVGQSTGNSQQKFQEFFTAQFLNFFIGHGVLPSFMNKNTAQISLRRRRREIPYAAEHTP